METAIKVDRPFVLYCNCNVFYNGRAKSQLQNGNYLIIRKGDGSLLIHGGIKMTPINYQSPGAIMTINNNILLSHHPKYNETIIININNIISYMEMVNISSNDKDISRTESQLRDKIASNLDRYIKTNFIDVMTEFRTPVGIIDIVGIDDNQYHLIEVKRGRANISCCSQILRYSGYFKSIGIKHDSYIMSPSISSGAEKYIINSDIKWVEVTHD